MTTAPRAGGGELPPAASVLAVCAHPDDESFGVGAVLDRFVERGAAVAVLCFTRGDASTLGPPGAGLGELRSSELANAAAELGVTRLQQFEHPDGSLGSEPLDQLAAEVATMAEDVGADLLVVFDEGGVTGHPDHRRATEAALAARGGLPVLAWGIPRHVADALNEEFGTGFAGRSEDEIDVVLRVDRTRQSRAIACHPSQCDDNPVLERRLTLLGDTESLRWLRRPPPDSPPPAATAGGPGHAGHGHGADAEEWDRRYSSRDRLFRAEPDETLVEVLSPQHPGRAVDFGAGEGRNSLWLASHGWEVTAVDFSRQALDRLGRQAGELGLDVTTVAADLVGYMAAARSRGETFDLVVLAYVHPEAAARAGLLAGAAALVAPGGHLFVVGHHRFVRGVAGPFDPSRLYGEHDLRQAARGLEVLRLERRHGKSDVPEPASDLVLWARRPGEEVEGGDQPS